jgi:hypothetical protein
MTILSQRLRDAKVYRIGKTEVVCYVAGIDGNGNISGLRTVAIET